MKTGKIQRVFSPISIELIVEREAERKALDNLRIVREFPDGCLGGVGVVTKSDEETEIITGLLDKLKKAVSERG